MPDNHSIDWLQNATVFGNDGEKIGTVGQVYLDDQSDQPTFVTVKTGLFGLKETFVPVDQAAQTDDGLQVPYDKAFIKDAPNVDPDGLLSPDEERRLYEHYSMEYRGGGGRPPESGTEPGSSPGTDSNPDADSDRDLGLAAAQDTAATGIGGLGTQRGDTDETASDLNRDVNTANPEDGPTGPG
ncbi:PRC-barrel domain-containing protein [Citricoccus sp. GCM10030269]|uniref:PRC-barrel domain-containing protein n=1 Tax=Citricoccus sp. GCM10030269 TaxID=3273388 RepID=UPI00362169C3